MPNYEVSEAGQALIDNYPEQLTQAPRPYPAAMPSAAPFAYNSWEAMTNIEKFDHLKGMIETIEARLDSYWRQQSELAQAFAGHNHSPQDGSVLVKYNR